MKQPLMPKQRAVMDFIERFIAEHRHAPTFEQIALANGFRSLSTVDKHMKYLVAKGWLRKRFNSPRSIELVPDHEEVLAILDQIISNTETSGTDFGMPHVAELARQAKELLK